MANFFGDALKAIESQDYEKFTQEVNLKNLPEKILLNVIENTTKKCDYTLLHVAAQKDDVRFVKYLIECGADVEAEATAKHTALYEAASNKKLANFIVLFTNHASVASKAWKQSQAKTYNSRYPLSVALSDYKKGYIGQKLGTKEQVLRDFANILANIQYQQKCNNQKTSYKELKKEVTLAIEGKNQAEIETYIENFVENYKDKNMLYNFKDSDFAKVAGTSLQEVGNELANQVNNSNNMHVEQTPIDENNLATDISQTNEQNISNIEDDLESILDENDDYALYSSENEFFDVAQNNQNEDNDSPTRPNSPEQDSSEDDLDIQDMTFKQMSQLLEARKLKSSSRKKEIRDLKSKIHNIENDLKKLQSENEKQKKINDANFKQIDNQQEELSQIKEDYEALKEDNSKLKEEVNKSTEYYQNVFEDYVKENSDLAHENEELEQTNSELTSALSKSEEKGFRKQAKAVEYKKLYREGQERIRNFQRNINQFMGIKEEPQYVQAIDVEAEDQSNIFQTRLLQERAGAGAKTLQHTLGKRKESETSNSELDSPQTSRSRD